MKSLFQFWQTWAVLSAASAAMTAILAKVGVEAISSDLATFIRTAVVLALAAFVVSIGGGFAQMSAVPGRTWLFLALSGLATGASWLCYFRALKLGDASRVAPIDKLSVVFIAIFAAFFLGERLSPQGIAGVALIATGAMLIAWQ
ncbi:EamA family transporter [Pleomorphomonas sp. JP5]|uniref:EamA family transporter n=1 Tax=Pleomorphomonas sp. JP5 TaxID=2942998 RepID=UPI002044CD86|nr:EamA family transporter [Pleomorphomonas sp. JP5]MCM5559901.1 EamA family transporter [Pleomorphomonas sp. JP5]